MFRAAKYCNKVEVHLLNAKAVFVKAGCQNGGINKVVSKIHI